MERYHSTVEVPEPIDAKIEGNLPSWLDGCLYRNGPAKFEFGDTKFNHWFDGSAMVHRFHISQGKVNYRNKFVRTDSFVKNSEANRIVVSEFGTAAYPDPCKNIFRRFFSFFSTPDATDNTNVHVFPIGEALYTATETNYLRKIDPETLDTIGNKMDLTKIVSVNGATAHPHWDREGNLHNLGAIHAGGTKYTIVKLTPAKEKNTSENNEADIAKAEIVAQVPAENKLKPGYFHSFAMTENYYVLIEQPMVINVLKILTAKLRGVTFATAMEWHPEMQTRFHIIERATGKPVNGGLQYVGEPFMVFHHINVFEEKGELIMDICAFDASEGAIVQDFVISKLQGPGVERHLEELPKPRARRYVFPLTIDNQTKNTNQVSFLGTSATASLKDDGKVHCTHHYITEAHVDFPQLNYAVANGRKYRYFFAAGFIRTQVDSLMKVDTYTGEYAVWEESGCFPSEPVFVAAPDATEEDEGVVLSVILGPDCRAFVLVLDGRTFKELARASVDAKIGAGTHGSFIPSHI